MNRAAKERMRASTWARRAAWLLALWAGGVAVLAALTALLKLAMRAAGLGA